MNLTTHGKLGAPNELASKMADLGSITSNIDLDILPEFTALYPPQTGMPSISGHLSALPQPHRIALTPPTAYTRTSIASTRSIRH